MSTTTFKNTLVIDESIVKDLIIKVLANRVNRDFDTRDDHRSPENMIRDFIKDDPSKIIGYLTEILNKPVLESKFEIQIVGRISTY